MSETKERGNIIYVQYTNAEAYPPLEHSSQIFVSKEWKAFFLSLKLDRQPSGNLSFKHHPSIRVRCLLGQPPGIRQKLHFIWFSLWVLLWIIILKPRILYLSQPEATLLGLIASYIIGGEIIYHEHDSPPQHPYTQYMRMLLWTRNQVAKRAIVCILPNEQRAEDFYQVTGTTRPIKIVWNCPRLEEVVPPRSDVNKEHFVLWYHGTVVPFRLPLNIVRALAKLPNCIELRFAGYVTSGHKHYLYDFLHLSCKLGIENRVKYFGTLPTREELLNECRNADLGLALANPEKDINTSGDNFIGASNKPFDYLACGVGLLVSPQSAYKSLFAEPGYGIVCDPTDLDSVVSTLNWAIEHRSDISRMGEAGRQRILRDWNYESQFQPVLDQIMKQTQ